MSGLMTEYDKEHGGETKLNAVADFNGPMEKEYRSCTDPFCFLLIVLVWASMIVIGGWCYVEGGDPFLLVSPTDYLGRICGHDNKTSNEGILPENWYTTDILTNGVCVEKCPNTTILNPRKRSDLICKEENDIMNMSQCLSNGEVLDNYIGLVVCGACMYQMESTNVIDRCIPVNMSQLINFVEESAQSLLFEDYSVFGNLKLFDLANYIERFGNDILISWRLILTMGIGGTTVLSFLTLYLIRFPVLFSCLVWLSCFMTPILVAMLGGFCFFLAGGYLDTLMNIEVPYLENKEEALRISAYVLWSISGLFVCVLVFMRKRINLGIGITKATAHSLVDMPFVIFYPFVSLVSILLFLVVWILIMLLLSSMRNMESSEVSLADGGELGELIIPYTNWTYDTLVYYLFWYMFFVLFWTGEYIVAMGELTLAICFSTWYFRREEISVSVCQSMIIAFLKHSGTAAFGSLIIAIIRLIRSLLLYLHKKLKQSNLDNKCIDIAMCCCQCCMACLERCLKFIHKNAYIQTAIFGYSFCKASREAFFLICRNAARMAAVGLVSTLSIWFCRLVVVIIIGESSYFILQYFYSGTMWSIAGISFFIAIISWFVNRIFMETVEVATATLLQCFIADEEMYPGGSLFVPKELDSFLKRVEEEN